MSNLFEINLNNDATSELCSRYALIVPERGVDFTASGLTYAVPAHLANLEIGQRVFIPLGRGNKPAAGYVIEIDTLTDLAPSKIKKIIERDPNRGSLTPELIKLGRWMSQYYCCPLGMVLATMLPAAVKHGTGRAARRMVKLNHDLITITPDDNKIQIDYVDTNAVPDKNVIKKSKLTPLQKAIIQNANQLPDDQYIDPLDLAMQAGAKSVAPVNRLVKMQLLIEIKQYDVRAKWDQEQQLQPPTPCAPQDSSTAPYADYNLTKPQTEIIEDINHCMKTGFGVHVLYGITGSGKTEVYLHLINRVIAAGKYTIMLVPEISLTPQTTSVFRQRFGNKVAILHSGLTAAQRNQQWNRVQQAEVSVIVGARSAVFAPIPDKKLGLIIVDEEHDGSYKQDQLPRYHGRNVAIKRAQIAETTVILGSATPSMESYYNACIRKIYKWHVLSDRVPGMKIPTVEVVDLAEENRIRAKNKFADTQTISYSKGIKNHLLGPRLEYELAAALTTGGQAMLLLNRRGYANYICCTSQMCGWVMYCDECDAAMVFHKDQNLPRGGFVQCHHCHAEKRIPDQCPLCHSNSINRLGMGTQRIEEELIQKFPQHLILNETLVRMDSDTMHRAADYYDALERFRNGQVRVIVGTQMIAKGHDFPNVSLVGVINADTAINMPDFRAAERTYQLIAQVAGRAGRSERAGLVIVQTMQPKLPAIQYAANHDYHSFAQREYLDRKNVGLPPVVRMARIVVRNKDHVKCKIRSQKLTQRLMMLAKNYDNLTIEGPAPCPISRLDSYYRYSMEILANKPGILQNILTALRNEGLAKSDAATAIDVDPINLL